MGKVNYMKRWVGQELDDESVRKRFIRHLKKWHNEFTTPWWDCGFNKWLVYGATIQPCGLRVESIAEGIVTLIADCTEVQTEGICLEVTFRIPTTMFQTPDLMKMIGPYRYQKNGPVTRFKWFPENDDPRINPIYITDMAWWYDSRYDESVKEDND